MKLSEVTIKSLKGKNDAYRVSDGLGLHIAVSPSGKKNWHFRYRFAGREGMIALGKYPEISLAEARELRFKNQKILDSGIDPCAEKRRRREELEFHASNSFGKIATEWFEARRSNWTPKHQQKIWRRLELYVFPHLGTTAVSAIKPLEVLRVIQRIEATGATEMSHCQLSVTKRIFRYAVITGRLQYNPAADLSEALRRHRVKHQPSLRSGEIRAFLNVFRAYEGDEVHRIGFELLLLSALRTCEVRFSKWSDIDLEAREWRLRPEIMKMRDAHLVPLSDQAVALLLRLKRLTGHQEWLLPSSHTGKGPTISENFANKIIARLGYKGRVVGHGFRAMFSTIANSARCEDDVLRRRFDADVIEKQLAHQERNQSRGAYNHAEYWPERQLLMQWWADFLTNQETSTKQRSSELIPFSHEEGAG